MTTEICLLNRYAAVLAADSATTTSHWDEGKQQRVERYFKGANKVFQLSSHHPVGLMIYDNASLHSVPWEVLVKEFRAALKDQSFASPKEYADALFQFLRGEPWLFEAGIIDQNFVTNATVAALSVMWDANNLTAVTNAANDADQIAAVRLHFDNRLAQSRALALDPLFTNADIDTARRRCAVSVSTEVAPLLAAWKVANDLTADELAEFGIESVYKTFKQALRDYHTGIVVAGFGAKQMFPSFSVFDCYGFVLDRLAIVEDTSGSVSHEYPAQIRAFAQTSEVDTFMLGISRDVFSSMSRNIRAAIGHLIDEAQRSLGGTIIPNANVLLEAAVKQFFDGMWSDTNKVNRDPLYRVIGHLPVAEMADLAETLISLQSLKERVTAPSQSVGGPIDVAAITRSEGLVWIKRKHYFSTELNPRFLARLQIN